MKKWMTLVAAVALLMCLVVPSVSFTEDRDTVLLARTIYAIAKDESYEAKLAVGTVVMNRVENAWFGGSMGEVLREQHQFAFGKRYDADSLKAAHAVLSGERALDSSALYYHFLNGTDDWSDQTPVKCIGSLGFYAKNGND